MRRLLVLAALSLLVACTRGTDKFYWLSHCEDLESGKYRACYGPGIKRGDKYKNFHSSSANTYLGYQVDVVKVETDESYKVLFTKQFTNSQVDARLLSEEPSKVVTYDPALRLVRFDLGPSQATYRIAPGNGP